MKDRKDYIGASDSAAVLGLSRWQTPLGVWAVKTGQVDSDDISDKVCVKLGHKLEQTVAEFFMEETGKKVHRVNETLFHPKHPFIGCNLDRRVVGEKAVLECKTASAWKSKEWDGDDMPREYVIQVMHQLLVTGAERGYLAVLIGNQDFKWKVIERDEKALKTILEREVDFWTSYVVPKVMPGVMSGDKENLLGLWPEAVEEKTIQLDDAADAVVESIEGMRADLRGLEMQIEKSENELRAMLKDASVGLTERHKIFWTNQTTRRFDTDKFKEENPELYEKFRKPTTRRKFLITANTKEKTNEQG